MKYNYMYYTTDVKSINDYKQERKSAQNVTHFLQLTSSASAVIWNEAEVCPAGKFRTPLVGVTSRSAKGVVTCQATEISVNVPLLLMMVKVVVEGMVVKEESRGGSAVGCVWGD